MIEKVEKNSLLISATELCDLNCPYCFENLIEQRHFDKKFLDIHDSYFNNDDYEFIELRGGEPGLLTDDELLMIFNKAKSLKNLKVMEIDSNGKILSKNLFKLSSNLNNNVKFKIKWHITSIESFNKYISMLIENEKYINYIEFFILLYDIHDYDLILHILNNIDNISFLNKLKIEASFPEIITEKKSNGIKVEINEDILLKYNEICNHKNFNKMRLMSSRDKIQLKKENVTLKYLKSIINLNSKIYDSLFNDHYTASCKIHMYNKETRK